MKYLILLGDGMADFPLDTCQGKTPLAAANTPAMDALAREGISGLFCPIPEGYPPGSDIGNLSVFGYNPATTFTGRAPLEAFNQGIELGPNDIAFRCNLVTLKGDVLEDFTADHISSEEGAELIEALNAKLATEALRFHNGVGYRHLAVIKASGAKVDHYAGLRCTPPHDIIGKPYEPHLPQGADSEDIVSLMRASQEILKDHPINTARIKDGKLPATSVWLWGQGKAPSMELYADRFRIRGAVISAVDLVNGIGRCAGLEVLRVEGATGYVDTNYEGKVDAALDALKSVDFVYLHIEAPDEASHEGDTALKIRAIEDFDKRVVAPCLAHARDRGDCRILVAPDHVTSIESRTHAGGPVPFALWGPGVQAGGRACYSEEEAKKSGVLFPEGHTLVPYMLETETVVAAPAVS